MFRCKEAVTPAEAGIQKKQNPSLRGGRKSSVAIQSLKPSPFGGRVWVGGFINGVRFLNVLHLTSPKGGGTLKGLKLDCFASFAMTAFSVFAKNKFILFLLFLLPACAKLEQIGKEPQISPSLQSQNAIAAPNLMRYSAPPKPQQIAYNNQPNNTHSPAHSSLWQSGPASLFGDRRAKQVGDILTVDIEIDDKAEFNNKTERKRTSNNDSSITAALGINEAIDKVLPSPLSLSPGVETTGVANSVGDGKINRREKINLKIAAIVTNILPNGNMVIQGSQEVRVNYELRDLQVTGLIRPEDISRRNTISYDKIAEARISYGGRGQVSGLQQPRYGDQFLDIVSPF